MHHRAIRFRSQCCLEQVLLCQTRSFRAWFWPQMKSQVSLNAWQKEGAEVLVRRMENNRVQLGVMSFNVLIDACARVRRNKKKTKTERLHRECRRYCCSAYIYKCLYFLCLSYTRCVFLGDDVPYVYCWGSVSSLPSCESRNLHALSVKMPAAYPSRHLG